jgi:c-di-GMP-binding flagellar brake protein YcgR
MSLPIDESVDSYTITFRREIIFYLRQLINDKDPVSISFNEGNDTILTILLDVDEEESLLYFDWGSSEEVNKRFLQSDRNFFVAMPGGVRNQFLCGKPQATTQGGRPAFAVKLPEKYVRLQRREFFRLVLPMTQRPTCYITHEGKTMELATVDIGIGGVGLETPELLFPCGLGAEFADVRIEFKGFGDLRAPLAVRYAGEITKGTKQVKRLGCTFLKLSAAQENLVQKFMAHIQREERAKLG